MAAKDGAIAQAIAEAEAAKIEADYDTERLKALINSDGWAAKA